MRRHAVQTVGCSYQCKSRGAPVSCAGTRRRWRRFDLWRVCFLVPRALREFDPAAPSSVGLLLRTAGSLTAALGTRRVGERAVPVDLSWLSAPGFGLARVGLANASTTCAR